MRRVLIVEESPLLAQAIERAGDPLPFATDRATDGWDAISKLETEDYAAIVIDTDLPRQSGFGVLTYLREEVGADMAHVIVVTSGDAEEIRRKVEGEGVRVITKTGEVDDIAREVVGACS